MPVARVTWWVAGCGLLALLAIGCSGGSSSTADGGPDGHQADAGEDAPGRAVIEIYFEGDSTPKTYGDGYSGQTPRDYFMGVQRFELLRAADDPDPVTVFDFAPGYTEVDMATKTLVGVGRTGQIPAGTYSHGRLLLTMARLTVNATAHGGTTSLGGTMSVLDAISETTIDGAPFAKGQCRLEFVSGTYSNTQSYPLPPLVDLGGGTIVDDGPRTFLLFPFPLPMPIDPADTATHRATVTLDTYEAFRWEEKQLAGYAGGVWDISANLAEAEVVKNFGVTGYRLATE